MAQVFNAYLDAGKSDRFLLKLAAFWKDTPVERVRPGTIRQAARTIYPTCNAPTWNRQVIKPTQAAINHAAELGWCQRISVKKFTESPKKKTPATSECVLAFRDQAIADGLPHLAALCVFMIGTAARVGESCRLTWADVDLSDGTAQLHLFKPVPWSRIAFLHPEVIAAIANIPSNRKPDERVFRYAGRGSVKSVWENVTKRAGIEPLTPHCCRHGFATTLLHRGKDPKTIAEHGGWKDATTVLRTDAHAVKDRSATNALFDTTLTQGAESPPVTHGQKR